MFSEQRFVILGMSNLRPNDQFFWCEAGAKAELEAIEDFGGAGEYCQAVSAMAVST